MLKITSLLSATIIALFFFVTHCRAADQGYGLAWTPEAGGEPWGYVEHAGIMAGWLDRFGPGEVKIVQAPEYFESIKMYVRGEVDACTMRLMDALTIPALRGVDSTVLIIGDFSRGGEGVVMRNGLRVTDLKGRRVRVGELSVSHYLLTRALALHGMSESDVVVVNTRDEDIADLFAQESAAGQNAAASTRDGYLTETTAVAGASVVFDSSLLAGEIMDVLLVRTGVSDDFKRALAGAWFQAMQIVGDRDNPERAEALRFMAGAIGVEPSAYKIRLKKKKFLFSARESAAFMKSRNLKNTVELISSFAFAHGLYGRTGSGKNVIGVLFPDGSVMGNEEYVKLRFDDSYMRMASDWLWLQ